MGNIKTSIQTYSGRMVDLMNFTSGDVNIEDIATALSHLCRFTGHVNRFYSVGEHCLHMAIVAASEKRPVSDILGCLMHDSGECYVGDIARPLKRMVPLIKELEDNIFAVISAKLELPPISDYVHDLDNRMLATEKRDLLADVSWGEGWTVRPIETYAIPKSLPSVYYIKSSFIYRFNQLSEQLRESKR